MFHNSLNFVLFTFEHDATIQGRNKLFISGGQFSWNLIRWRHRPYSTAVAVAWYRCSVVMLADTVMVIFIEYVTHVTIQTSMQAHGQEEMFAGHNQVGWSSNTGKWWLCDCVVAIYVSKRLYACDGCDLCMWWMATIPLSHQSPRGLSHSMSSNSPTCALVGQNTSCWILPQSRHNISQDDGGVLAMW